MPTSVETYTYTLPEGYTMEPKFREKLDALVYEAGLSNELAQKFIDLHIELTEDFVQRLQEETTEQPEETVEEKTKALKVAEYTPETPDL